MSHDGSHEHATAEQLRELEHERACLLAVLAGRYPARLERIDAVDPPRSVLYLHTPAGQVSWSIHSDDLDLLSHVPFDDVAGTDAHIIGWDGHDRAEALARLQRLVELENAGGSTGGSTP